MRSAPFHNGFGMMAVTGTRKPIWRAFELLANAGTERLAVTGNVSPLNTDSTVSVLATKGGAGAGPLGLQLFVANYRRLLAVQSYSCDRARHQCVPDPHGSYTDDSACNSDCRQREPTRRNAMGTAAPGHPWPPLAHSVTIRVTHAAGAAAAVASATMRRIDSTHANAFAEWTGPMGNVTYPTPQQIERLGNVSALVAEPLAVTKLSATELSVTLTLPAEDSAVHIAL